jgi:excinuclease ABC subunit A
MSRDDILVVGAREHNLKNITVRIPRNALTVITGLSGSGKSSLAFDTLYAEGQRKYVESLSAYARQFLDQMQKPDVEHIEGLSPAISIEQRTAGANPRSIVATTTEIHDYLRLLYASIGKPHCPQCRRPITQQNAEQIVTHLCALPAGTKLMVLAPKVQGRKGEHADVLEALRKAGFARVRVDGEVVEIEKVRKLDKRKAHHIEVVVDRIVINDKVRTRLTDSVETALRQGEGVLWTLVEEGGTWKQTLYSEKNACLPCGLSFEALTPAPLLLQQPLRRLCDLPRAGHHDGVRRGPGGAKPRPAAGGGHPPLAARRAAADPLLQAPAARGGRALQGGPGPRPTGSCPRSSPRCCCTGRARRSCRSASGGAGPSTSTRSRSRVCCPT